MNTQLYFKESYNLICVTAEILHKLLEKLNKKTK